MSMKPRNAPARWRAGVVMALLAILSCDESPTAVPPPPPVPRPATLSVSPPTAELSAFDETFQLTAEVRDQNGQVLSGVAVTWGSSDAAIATVSASGLVTAAGNGSATITASAGSASGSASVIVAQRVHTVAVTPEADTLVGGESRQLAAEATDANGYEVAAAEFRWTSGDTSIVAVDSSGLATAIASGETVVTAVSSGVTGEVELRVLPPAPTTVAVTPQDTTLMALGDTVRLVAEVRDQIGRRLPDAEVTWSSGDEAVVTVDSTGLARTVGPGTTSVSATSGTASGRATVKVMQSVDSVTVSPPAATVSPGDTLRLTAEALDENGHPVADAVFDWVSGDAGVAAVDDSGLVRGIAEGAATITATAGSASGSAQVTVANPDRAALVAFYEATGGPGWNQAHNWLTDAPLATWSGVQVDGSRVTRLHLARNNLRGTLPPEIGDLSSLGDLTLWGNRLTGALPPELGDLVNLRILNLNGNAIQGAIPPELGNLANLRVLNFRINGLSERIPPELGNLSRLEELDLGGNLLSGPIPPELGNLSALTNLSAWSNDLSGPIPPALGRLKNLNLLNLAENELTGPLAPELGGLFSLKRLIVRVNRLTGPVPRSFLQLANHLESFQFAGNPDLCIPGTAGFVAWMGEGIPRESLCNSSDLSALESLHEAAGGANWIRSDGWLEGAATSEWYGVHADSLGRVTRLDLSGNSLSGELPANLGGLMQIESLRLDGNPLSGRLPLSLMELSLQELRYGDTELCAPSDAGFQEWLNAVAAHEGTGRMCGPQAPRDILEVAWKAMGGSSWRHQRNWLTSAPFRQWQGLDTDASGQITRVSLPFNDLTGFIPPELSGLPQLTELRLRGNRLAGNIPSALAGLSMLEHLHLSDNRLTGPIPPALGDLSRLESLALAENGLTGPIPSDLGDLSRLKVLALAGNRLTGPIPPGLGNLGSIETLDLSGNGLAGAIPQEFGLLSSLTSVRLRENELTGSIPSTLGNLSNLEELVLARNDLSGGVPPELGELANLRILDLSDNMGLAGALPAELTSLRRLRTLQTGGTDLCAPSDDRFLEWLDAVGDRRVARCSLASAYLTQAVQSREFPVPLVAGREALLRVFVASADAGGTGIPAVRARLYVRGSEVHVADIPAQSTPIPTEVNESDLRASANATIPGSVVQPGLEMVIEVDPDGTVDPDLGLPGRIPETGRLEIEVQSMPTLDLTFVPFLWDQAPDSTVLNLIAGMVGDPEGHEGLWGVRTFLPVREIGARAHEPVVTSSTAAGDLLRETIAIRTMEGASGHYMGMMAGGRGYAGLALFPGRVAFARSDPVVMAHELAHNMSLGHAPCGASRFLDPAYPHEGGLIGSWGFDARERGGLVAPHSWDLMGYCSPKWISGYNFTKAARFRLHDEAAGDGPGASAPMKTLLVWGGTDEDGSPFLEPAFVVRAAPALPRPGGAYEIKGRTADGSALFFLRFEMPAVADGEGSSSFAFALPAQPAWADDLADITLSGPGGSVTIGEETNPAVAILRDPDTGRVRGILRGVSPADLARGAVSAVSLEAGLEILLSRGIPAPPDWRR